MSWRDRDYNRDDASYGYRGSDGGGGFGGGGGFSFGLGGGMTYMVKWLLIINIAIFVIDIFSNHALSRIGAFTYAGGVSEGQLWRWVTYQFLHANFLHIAFNMFMLFMFGPLAERWWGSRRFLAFYLLCGASGAWFYSAMGVAGLLPIFGEENPLVGASGSLFGVLVTVAVVSPSTMVQFLFIPYPIKIRTLVWGFLALAVARIFIFASNPGGEAAHLGGAAFGYLLVKYPKSLNFAEAWGPGDFSDTLKRKRAEREQRKAVEEEEEVDRILAKVKKEGVGNLTEKEKDTLKRATERQNKAG